MEQPFKLFNIVRIKQMVNPIEEYEGWSINKKTPQIGEVGVLVDVLSTPECPDKYVVESVAKDGSAIWLAEFFAQELEIVHT